MRNRTYLQLIFKKTIWIFNLELYSRYAVILGEHDKSTVNDCDHSEDCHNTTVTIRIDDITVHPEFDSSSTLRRHDIALIRLDEMVTYSGLI